MKNKDATLFELYVAFLKIGGLTFGGGYAMLPMLQREVIAKHSWVTEEEVLDIYAIGQVTPGIIAINTATMIGYRKRGLLGAIVATLGEVTPSLVFITALATVLLQVKDYPLVQHAFGGIRVGVCVLVTQSIISLSKKSLVDVPTVIMFLLTVIGTFFFSVYPLWFVISGILYGLLVKAAKRRVK